MFQYFNKSHQTRKRYARRFIVLALSLFFFLPLFSARADLTNDVQSIKQALDNLSADLDIDLRDIISTVDDNTAQLYNLYTRQVTSQTFTSYIDWLAGLLGSGQSYGPTDNILKYVRDIRNSVAGADNPWWATNSTFVLAFNSYSQALPDDGKSSQYTFSFPQFMSIWSSRLSYRENALNSAVLSQWHQRWGTNEVRKLSGQEQQRRGYTWFDWISDATRSNWVMRAGEFASSTNQLSEWAARTGADVVEEFSADTNKLSIGNSTTNTIDDVLDTFDDTTDGLDSKLDLLFNDTRFDFGSIFPSFTGRDPTIEIFPECDIGGVHVAAVRGSIALPQPLGPIFRQVCSGIYVITFLMMGWRLIKTEYTYWTSLGHTEGSD